MRFTKEQIEQAMTCKSVDELLTLAQRQNVALTKDEAQKYFGQLSGQALTPEDIEDVAGGCTGNVCAGNISAAC